MPEEFLPIEDKMKNINTRNNQLGFSLVEALVILAISSIIAAIAMPSWQSMIVNNKIDSAQKSLRSSLQLARSMAISQGTPIYITAASEGFHKGWVLSSSASTSFEQCNIESPQQERQCLGVAKPSEGLSITADNDRTRISLTATGTVGDGSVELLVCDEGRSNEVRGRVIELSAAATITSNTVASCS